MKRTITNQPGWGPTAFTARVSDRIEIETFLGEGWITLHHPNAPINLPLGSLDLFLELQRDGRLPEAWVQ